MVARLWHSPAAVKIKWKRVIVGGVAATADKTKKRAINSPHSSFPLFSHYTKKILTLLYIYIYKKQQVELMSFPHSLSLSLSLSPLSLPLFFLSANLNYYNPRNEQHCFYSLRLYRGDEKRLENGRRKNMIVTD